MSRRMRQLAAMLLAVMMLLPVAAQAAAADPMVVCVSTADELDAAIATANTLAAQAKSSGGKMERMTIQLQNDITMTRKLSGFYYFDLLDVNLLLTSAPGKTYTLRPATYEYGAKLISMFNITNTDMTVERVVIDCMGTDEQQMNAVFMKEDSVLTLGEGSCVTHGTGMFPLWNTSGELILNGAVIRDNHVSEKVMIPITATIALNADTKLTIYDADIINNSSYYLGVIRAVGAEAVIHDALIENNTSLAGAVYVTNGKLTMYGGTVRGNRAEALGPMAAVGEYGPRGEGGGGVSLWNGSTGELHNVTIADNYTDLSAAGVNVFNRSTLVMDGCIVTGNVSESHAGGVNVADGFTDADTRSSVIITNTLIADNVAKGSFDGEKHQSDPYAPGGGGIFVHENCELTLGQGTVVQNNRAIGYGYGGGVCLAFGAHAVIDGAIVRNNTAQLDGGGVYVDGAGMYEGWQHPDMVTHPGAPDDGYGVYTTLTLKDGAIIKNTAGRNGGGVFVHGRNTIEVDGETIVYNGGTLAMTGGVITENKAMDMGGGVYVGSAPQGKRGGALEMTGGAIYLNVAGERGNTSSGADDAGADVYSEGGNAYISVVAADDITAYVQDTDNSFVPAYHRRVYFTNWYDDYSDQDPDYGKAPEKIGTGVNTGRYKSSRQPDRMVYAPLPKDGEYNALILDYELPGLPRTGDDTPLWVYAALAAMSLAVACAVVARSRRSNA